MGVTLVSGCAVSTLLAKVVGSRIRRRSRQLVRLAAQWPILHPCVQPGGAYSGRPGHSGTDPSDTKALEFSSRPICPASDHEGTRPTLWHSVPCWLAAFG